MSDYNVTLHLSREGNWLQKGEDWVKLHDKREAAKAAISLDPDLLMAYVNSSLQESRVAEVEGAQERRSTKDQGLLRKEGPPAYAILP